MIARDLSILALAASTSAAAPPAGGHSQLAEAYVEAIEKLNSAHAANPGRKTEVELSARLPRKASLALASLVEAHQGAGLEQALATCARAALELDRLEDFDRARDALAKLSADAASDLGVAFSGERVLVIAEGGLSQDYARHFADVVADVLAAYDKVFGFEEFSKVPGKKLRVRVHIEQEITRPPHFAPQYPHHSEIDFPVIDSERLRSPTAKGQFLFYGLCHERGHVIAMWGSQAEEQDHHAWAHYTGVTIVEHLAQERDPPEWLAACTDVRWRSLTQERQRLAGVEPGASDRDGVLARLIALHDLVGPRAIGNAINDLDEKDERRRINRVRYYTFRELSKALIRAEKGKPQRKALEALFE
jgi:hypothetical protein